MLAAPRRIEIGPQHHGRKMSLKAFEFAKTVEGYRYELSRGVITVSEVANFYHALIVAFIRDEFATHRRTHRDQIYVILTETACKLLIPQLESERHPDIAVYLTRPKGPKNRKVWRTWIPEIVIEVISASSDHRDYVEKREEYFKLGVKEYWIVDAKRGHVVALRRGKSDWIEKRLGSSAACATKLLPGFTLPCRAIFEAADEMDEDEE